VTAAVRADRRMVGLLAMNDICSGGIPRQLRRPAAGLYPALAVLARAIVYESVNILRAQARLAHRVAGP
jgi:hypothetical protein